MISNLINRSKKTNETGVISIITVVVLSMVLTLITTAFVKSASSNQRQALDAQLSTQAFYAAESGINDVTSILKNGLTNDEINGALNTDDCGSFLGVIRTHTSLLGSTPDVLEGNSPIKYTCVLVSNRVSDISLTKGNSAFFPIASEDDKVIKDLAITWGNSTNTVPAGTGTELPTKDVWGNNSVALIRLSFYYSSTFDRASLVSNQKTLFLRPVRSGGNGGGPPNYTYTLNASNSSNGSILDVNCPTSPCSVRLVGINSNITGGVKPFYLRIASIYSGFDFSPATVRAYDESGLQKNLIKAQYSIDVTGRANDVYRRIEVRRPITTNWNFPNAVVQSAGDLCKQFVAWPGGSADEAPGSCSFAIPTPTP